MYTLYLYNTISFGCCYIVPSLLHTVNLLLDLVLSGYATDSATLLTVHPLINGTSAGFKEYTPKSKR